MTESSHWEQSSRRVASLDLLSKSLTTGKKKIFLAVKTIFLSWVIRFGVITKPISSEHSKAVYAEFSLSFEEPEYSLKPPKLDLYRERRSKAKGVFSGVKAGDGYCASVT